MIYRFENERQRERIRSRFSAFNLDPVSESKVIGSIIEKLAELNMLPLNQSELFAVQKVPNKDGREDGTSCALGLVARCGWSADFITASESGPEAPVTDPYTVELEHIMATTTAPVETFPFGSKGLEWIDNGNNCISTSVAGN